MTEPTLSDCINYMKQQLKGMEKYPKSYEFSIPYYRKTIEFLEHLKEKQEQAEEFRRTMTSEQWDALVKLRELKQPRPHGEWVESKERKGHFYCSECIQQAALGKRRELLELFDYKYNFCPNCGADMREGDSDA